VILKNYSLLSQLVRALDSVLVVMGNVSDLMMLLFLVIKALKINIKL